MGDAVAVEVVSVICPRDQALLQHPRKLDIQCIELWTSWQAFSMVADTLGDMAAMLLHFRLCYAAVLPAWHNKRMPMSSQQL